MLRNLRTRLHLFLPEQFRDPFGLFIRLVKSRDSAAWFAMSSALMGVLATPLDLLLENAEKKLYETAPEPKHPIILVCGPPRSGTTLVEQVLINNLPVAYINNLTSIFPHSPIKANQIFGQFMRRNRSFSYESYYGKSTSYSGPNDALYLWDRWVGVDRSKAPKCISDSKKKEMLQFFGAYEQLNNKPMVAKNNSLNTYAYLVADVLRSAHFICLNRAPVYLAQSLLRARYDIHGDPDMPYGVDELDDARNKDPILDVCRQVRFHNEKISDQMQQIGSERFWVVPYETFCTQPEELVTRVYEEILDQHFTIQSMPPFKSTNRIRIAPQLFQIIEHELADLTESYYEA